MASSFSDEILKSDEGNKIRQNTKTCEVPRENLISRLNKISALITIGM